MSVGYVTVQWNAHKRVYDALIAASLVLYLGTFFFVGRLLYRGAGTISDEILALRALGSCAFLMLTVVLCIGPMARLDRRFLPLLYNRRHLGVMTFVIAFLHGMLAIGYYHGFGNINPLVSLLITNTNFGSLRAFPFQLLGLAALIILFLLAATSHDFWNRNLSARWWKGLHMMVYPAYGLVVMHVALGALQSQRTWWLTVPVCGCAALVCFLHHCAAIREQRRDRSSIADVLDESLWVDAGPTEDIAENRARTVCTAGGERIAVFRYGGLVSAITNVCVHQGGPLGEGKIIDGCVTCPWHGWQYRPADGQSPPPFNEKIATHRVKVRNGRVLVEARAMPPGTAVPPARIMSES